MNAPLTYAPAYLGLFASLWLALVCNSFLDIQYGGFAFEVFFWAAIHGWTLRVAWLQRGETSESGRQKQKIVLLIGLALFVLVFMPMWGLPRAGLYLLSMLQAAQNCVTTSRRQLHLGLLVSAVMVMFAASHYRADWTMLFYLLPYIIAVVFTLVAEQVSRRAARVRENSLKDTGRAGQGIAIAAATSIILILTGLFYVLTPQVTWPSLYSKYGQLSNLGWLGESTGEGQGGQGGDQRSEQAGGQDSPAEQGNAPADGESGSQSTGGGWPTAGQMREAAGRPGMPAWQASAIGELADLSEALGEALSPVSQALTDLIDTLKAWLKENRTQLLASLLALIVLMLLIALFLLLREARAGTWIRTRFDYLYLVTLGRHSAGRDGAHQFYRAMEHLFLLADTPRSPLANTREFLREATHFRDELRPSATEITLIFERYRYGEGEPSAAELAHMKQLYHRLYRIRQK
jgi:hypothetical protein